MGYWYFDESINESAGFIIGCYVYAPTELSQRVFDLLEKHNFNPRIDEYKSSACFSNNSQLRTLRDSMNTLLHRHATMATVIAPLGERSQFGSVALDALNIFISANMLGRERHKVYLDQGLFSGPNIRIAETHPTGAICELFLEQDSKKVGGIQLADLGAYNGMVRLSTQFGRPRKFVKLGPNSGYDPDSEAELDWVMWAISRYSFFTAGTYPGRESEPYIQVAPNGLYISPNASPELVNAAEAIFGTIYLGCIH